MSQYFQAGDQCLWNPSTGVAELFAATAEVMVPIAAKPSGIDGPINDEYEVDPALFGAFVDALARRYLGSNHLILRSLIEGFLATALVLVDRAGGTVAAMTQDVGLDMRGVSVGPSGARPPGRRHTAA